MKVKNGKGMHWQICHFSFFFGSRATVCCLTFHQIYSDSSRALWLLVLDPSAYTTMGDTGENGANKRRRTICSHDGKCILDLHNGTLAHISSYLHVPSRALFALALTTNASTWRTVNWDNRSRRYAGSLLSWVTVIRTTKRQPSEATTAIISGQPKQSWECIDFGEVETSLAIKLDDNDIAGVLACIDGVSNLKVLKITNCYNVKGRGSKEFI